MSTLCLPNIITYDEVSFSLFSFCIYVLEATEDWRPETKARGMPVTCKAADGLCVGNLELGNGIEAPIHVIVRLMECQSHVKWQMVTYLCAGNLELGNGNESTWLYQLIITVY